ncbi:pH regulation protein F [Desulfurispirillum indicum]|uniref:Multiple resistance and pH regulation protein F n=1 Tax=Desulfurispirillum indicum (strain ATCC BAA-1389 / DSM 22839 / S5) TaxID=653733 RepID=E6W1P8_DESIS|nr:monovalent cation/H+ antiporter complex subunit F [Desulfurispirillum indicum]ADU66597.1 multiple resistance and pH regulation protein F [Desulfurispirillum indicum S5]UCZ55916.1 pH regulation protein F [Desulfurispirillum indicum]
MSAWYLGAALFLLLNLFAGLLRVFRGPTHADRMLSVELFGTTTVAMLLLLAYAMDMTALLDVALLLVLLAVVATIAFVRGTGKFFR